MKKIVYGDPMTTSVDMVGDNLKSLHQLFPEAVTEGRIDFEILKQLLTDNLDERDEKYGLNWYGKRQSRKMALSTSSGTLRPCVSDSHNWSSTKNLMIDGDNLEVLKLLQKSYCNKVKLIYIDPPYNTGKDFVYPDDFQDSINNYRMLTGQIDSDGRKTTSNTESSGRFHTDWLNMMYPRLKVARNLLSSKGVIVISIDDSEVANLRLVCNEIFGEENFIANVVWQKKYTRANDAKFFSDNHDHLLVYAKDSSCCTMGRIDRGEEQLSAYSNPDNHPKGVWKATPLHARSGSNTSAYTFANGIVWAPPVGTYRRFSDETMKALEAGNEIWFGVDGTQVPSRKSFLSEMDDGMVPVTLWDHKFAGHNHEANNELKELGLDGTFTSPKPTRLISRLLELFTSKENFDIVLDFFAGSGTTGQAVMTQNAKDSGNREYILVQLPEVLHADNKDHKVAVALCDKIGKPRTIAELTKERLRRAITKIKKDYPQCTSDLGFRSFKLDSSNIRAWEPRYDDLEQTLLDHAEHIVPGRNEEDILYELLLKLGLDLTVPIEENEIAGRTVHSIGAGALMACLSNTIDRTAIEPLAEGIVQWHRKLKPAVDTRVVFRDSAFADDVSKSNLTAILQQHGLDDVRSL